MHFRNSKHIFDDLGSDNSRAWDIGVIFSKHILFIQSLWCFATNHFPEVSDIFIVQSNRLRTYQNIGKFPSAKFQTSYLRKLSYMYKILKRKQTKIIKRTNGRTFDRRMNRRTELCTYRFQLLGD